MIPCALPFVACVSNSSGNVNYITLSKIKNNKHITLLRTYWVLWPAPRHLHMLPLLILKATLWRWGWCHLHGTKSYLVSGTSRTSSEVTRLTNDRVKFKLKVSFSKAQALTNYIPPEFIYSGLPYHVGKHEVLHQGRRGKKVICCWRSQLMPVSKKQAQSWEWNGSDVKEL